MRSEQSQQRRKEGLAKKISIEEPSQSTAWKDALPHLDEALNKLPESDRRVLILHFFEEKTFPKVAQALGKSPAAAQKQSRRALEKLAQILKRKGVVITSLALGSCLTSELAKAAPPSVVKALSKITLTTNPPLLGTLVVAKAPLILAIAAAATLATFLGARQMEISQKKDHNQQLRAQLAQAPLKTTRPLRKASDSGGGRFQPDAALLAEAYYDADQTENNSEISAIRDYVQSLDQETLVKLLTQSTTPLLPRKHQKRFIQGLVSSLSAKDSGQALQILFDAYDHDPSQDFRGERASDFRFWLLKSIASGEALAWLQAREDAEGQTGQDDKSLNPFRAEALTHFLQLDFERATVYLQRFAENNQRELLTSVYRSYSRGYRDSDADQFLQLSAHFDEKNRSQFLRAFLQRRDTKPPLQWADELYQNTHRRAEDRSKILSFASQHILHSHPLPNQRIAKLQSWLDHKDSSLTAQCLGEAFASLGITKALQPAISYAKVASDNNWLAFYLSHEEVPSLLNQPSKQAEVLSLIEMIPDPTLRQQTRQYLSPEP